jgi:phosphatidate phosphatase APP1
MTTRMSRVTLVVLLLGAACHGEEETRKARLQAFDVLARPGEKITLRAKLELEGILGIDPNLHGVTLVFRMDGKEIGSARTADEGIASVPFTVPEGGRADLRVEVSVGEGSRYRAAPSTLLLAVRDGKRPILVTDIDNTIADVSSLEFLVSTPEEIPELPGAAEALGRLAGRFDIVYLTARDEHYVEATRKWLALRKFPPGPAFFRDLSLATLSARKYKTHALAALKKDWPTLSVGVGDRTEDDEAYLANGMTAILLGGDDLPEGAKRAASWADVEKMLAEDPPK